MPLPEHTAAPIDSKISLDDFIGEMNIDKDIIGPPPGSEEREPVPMPGVRRPLSPEEEAKISADTAKAAGEQLAALVDNGSRALCGIIGGAKEDKYRMSAGQRNDLADSYGRVAEHYGFSGANPLVEALLLTFIILTPKFKEAFTDRKMKKLEEEQERQDKEQKRMQADIALIQSKMKLEELNKSANGTEAGK